MAIYKQIQEKFWQNDFVLELTPEERYFYMYLITNTMTTLCGIYRFNLKLAVLETGLSAEIINKHLNTFEGSKKIIISKTSKEIMIVNWLKHNFKMNKRTRNSINAELKEVKDKELLEQFFEICKLRQYPIDEIFKGIIMPSVQKREGQNIGQAILKDTDENIVQAMPQDLGHQEKEAEEPSNEQGNNIVQALPEASGRQKMPTVDPSKDEANEPVKMLFTGLKGTSTNSRAKKRRGKTKEDIETGCDDIIAEWNDIIAGCDDIVVEDAMEEPIKDTVLSSWSFTDSGENGAFSASPAS